MDSQDTTAEALGNSSPAALDQLADDGSSRRAWSVAEFRRVWLATVLLSLGNWTERLVVGFFVLEQSGSVFLTAASFAARQAPALIAAPIAGSVVDRWPRRRVLALTAIYKALVLGALAYFAGVESPVLWPVFVITALGGIGQSFEIPATQGLVTDSVPRRLRMNAVATQSVGARGIGAMGALAAGTATDGIGVPGALGIGAAAFGAATLATLFIKSGAVTQTANTVSNAGKLGLGLFKQSFLDLKLLWGMPVVRVLLIAAVLVEMFGFAFGALLPSVSVNVLGTAGTGLGALNMMASFGSLGGVIVLAMLGDYRHKERLLVLITLLYGTFLMAFASSGLFPLSMVLILGVGMAAGAFDAMQWILLQANVPEHMRGRAIGGWVFAIGFGWVGHIGLGALGELIGVQWALGGAGLLVFATGVVLTRATSRLRRQGSQT